ncbi:unnamed protein product [Symbiodinium natans]|uniref:Protein kinase domain-containing protein n=1 Tax=Symbiodinium natans TaxID=878477 RepID=A0A812GHA7_9DINO|nr:unnamed protein product [Symbiodinium natans]
MEGVAADSLDPPIIEISAAQTQRHQDGTKTIHGFFVTKTVLGEGSFAKVKLCVHKLTGAEFAIKVFRKLPLRRKREFIRSDTGEGMKVRTTLDKVYDEISLMKIVSHSKCVRMHAVLDEAAPDGKLYVVLEYLPGGPSMEWDPSERCFRTRAGGPITEQMAQRYTIDTLQALDYLHGQRIAHRDVKPQNLLLEAHGSGLKLGDFGVAARMPDDCVVQGTEGTYQFFSPEMCAIGYKGHDGRRADIWAAGISLWAFLFHTLPFLNEVRRDSVFEPCP